MKQILIVTIIILSAVTNSFASDDQPVKEDKNTSIETSPLMAVFHYYAIRCNKAVTDNGDLLLGFAYLNTKWADQGRLHAYTLLTGYRYFFWKGIHTEYELWSAYDPFVSSVDGKTYKGVDFWHAIRAGYQYTFDCESFSPYLIFQIEVGRGLKRFNKWPNFENHTSVHPIFLIGIRF